MRIAMIGSRGVPAGVGGVEHVVDELTRELTARGHEVLVYARRWYQRTRPQAPLLDGARVIVTAGLVGKHCDTITHTATAMFDVLGRAVDLIHVFSPGPALLAFVPAAAGKKLIFTVQGPDWEAAKWSGPARWLLGGGLGMGMRFASAVAQSHSACGTIWPTNTVERYRIFPTVPGPSGRGRRGLSPSWG